MPEELSDRSRRFRQLLLDWYFDNRFYEGDYPDLIGRIKQVLAKSPTETSESDYESLARESRDVEKLPWLTSEEIEALKTIGNRRGRKHLGGVVRDALVEFIVRYSRRGKR